MNSTNKSRGDKHLSRDAARTPSRLRKERWHQPTFHNRDANSGLLADSPKHHYHTEDEERLEKSMSIKDLEDTSCPLNG